MDTASVPESSRHPTEFRNYAAEARTSKTDGKPDAKALRPYYEDLVAEFFPQPLRF